MITPELEKKINICRADKPAIVYNFFSNTNPDNWDGLHRSWIFRGQRSSKWDLIPSIFRSNIAEKWTLPKKGERVDYIEFCKREFKIIANFVKLSDSVGLKVPTDSHEFRSRDIVKNEKFPPKENIEIWAIAQHHGIPTRLLDFSHNGLYATYFAALDAFINNDYDGDLAVWAVNIGRYWKTVKKNDRRIQLVSVPSYDNNYLFSQKGIFLYDRDIKNKWVGKKQSHEIEFSIWQSLVEECKTREIDLKDIVKVMLYPKSKVKELLKCLHKDDINIASLMPNYDSIKKTLEIEKNINFERL